MPMLVVNSKDVCSARTPKWAVLLLAQSQWWLRVVSAKSFLLLCSRVWQSHQRGLAGKPGCGNLSRTGACGWRCSVRTSPWRPRLAAARVTARRLVTAEPGLGQAEEAVPGGPSFIRRFPVSVVRSASDGASDGPLGGVLGPPARRLNRSSL